MLRYIQAVRPDDGHGAHSPQSKPQEAATSPRDSTPPPGSADVQARTGAPMETVGSAVAAALELRNATDALPRIELPVEAPVEAPANDGGEEGASRSFTSVSQWASFCERVKQGRVRATCVIDFAYSDDGRWQGDDRPATQPTCRRTVTAPKP